MKKRFTATLLLIAVLCGSLLSLFSCGEKYEPVESTPEEERTVMTISLDSEEYDVPYELYRAFFLQLKSSIDGGNADVWTGAEKDKYIEKIDELIVNRIADIYSVFHLCEKADINVYSNSFDQRVLEYIEIAVEGGIIGDVIYEGFDGDYNAYLDSLKAMNLNYSVQDLLLRYQIALEELSLHYIGNIAEGDASDGAELGVIKYTKEDVEDFYFDSNASRRVLIAYLDEDYFTAARAEEIRDTIASKPDEKSVANYIASFTLGAPTSEIVGKYTYDKFYYSEFTNCAFSLEIGQTGPVITLKTDSFDGYIIVYRAASTAEYFESDYNTIAHTYLYTCFGQILEETAEGLSASKEYTKYLNELDRSAISMQ